MITVADLEDFRQKRLRLTGGKIVDKDSFAISSFELMLKSGYTADARHTIHFEQSTGRTACGETGFADHDAPQLYESEKMQMCSISCAYSH